MTCCGSYVSIIGSVFSFYIFVLILRYFALPSPQNSKGLPTQSSAYLNDSTPEPYKEQFGVRILVKCEEIKFRLQAPVGEDGSECTQVKHISLV